MLSGGKGRWLGGMGRVLVHALTSMFFDKKMLWYLATPDQADLVALKELVEKGELTPHVDRSFPLAETAGAFRFLESRAARGHVVVTP